MWEDRGRWFNEDGQVKPEPEAQGMVIPRKADLETKIRRSSYGGMKNEEHSWFLRVLRETLKLDPKERLDSTSLLSYLPPKWWAEEREDDEEETWDWSSLWADLSDEEDAEV